MAQKKSGKSATVGRRSKYAESVQPKLLLIEAWARDGLTDEDIAKKLGIAHSTLSLYKNAYSDFSEALKRGKEVVDVEVENALYKKTQGYNVKLKKTFKCKTIEYDSTTGRKIREIEELVDGVDEVHIPADTTAQIFWLKNRKPDAWRDKKETDVSGGLEIALKGDAEEWAK